MRMRPVWAVLGLIALAACEPYASTIPTSDRPQLVPQAQMPAACAHAASSRYAQRIETVSAAPAVQQPNGTWLVTGRYPSQGVTRSFECQFSDLGNLIGLYRKEIL